ncbi:MAG TPA: GFA family protein [Polyangiaceae bacterium]|nr:GFA family protein [Polyangiaceae bacterium]
MSEHDRHTGGCLCGAIRYELRGEPSSGNICYCTQCQRQTGAPVPAFVCYPSERFTLTAGAPATYRASDRARRQFCGTCGSSLFWLEDGSTSVDVFAGTLDEPGRLPPPSFAIWTAHRAPWVPELEGIRSYPAHRSPPPPKVPSPD